MTTTPEASAADNLDDGMRRLFGSLLSFFRSQLGPQFGLSDLEKLTRSVLDGMRTQLRPIRWDTAEPSFIESAKRIANVHRGLRIFATISEIHDPEAVVVVDLEGNVMEVESTCIRLIDSRGDTMWSLDVVGETLVNKLDGLRRLGRPVEVLCSPVLLPIKLGKRPDQDLGLSRKGFFLHIVDARSSWSTLDLLGASSVERGRAESLITQLRSDGVTPADFLFDQVVEGLAIVGLDELPVLRDVIRFTTLQALSTGGLGNTPAVLHGMIVGPPGHGKKLLGLAARVQNPVCVELSAAKTSLAGLIGSSRRTETGWASEPGHLPKASGGVAVVQDAHGWSELKMHQIGPVLQELTEDGVLRDSVSGGQRREVSTALLIDLNRTLHLASAGIGAPKEAAILRLRPLLSRLDLVAEIPSDPGQMWKVAEQMYATLRTSKTPLERQPWVRDVRLVVAALRDRHPAINLNDVQALMLDVHRRIQGANQQFFERQPEAGDVPARMAISFARFISASARSRDSSVATVDDVQLAARYVEMKLRFLQLHGMPNPDSFWADAGASDSDTWFRSQAGQEVSTQDAVEFYKRTTGKGVSERTMRRRLQDRGGKRTGRGRYLLPPPTEGT